MSLGICVCVSSLGSKTPNYSKGSVFKWNGEREGGRRDFFLKVSSCVVASGCKIDGKCKEEREAHLLSPEFDGG